MQYDPPNERDKLAGWFSGLPEIHGVLCGLLSGGAQDAERLWIEEVCSDWDPQESAGAEWRAELERIAAATEAAIGGAGFDFRPLLPDDDQALATRALALRDWSRGFLYGFGLSGMELGRLTADAREALGDLAAIANLDPDPGPESEANEAAWVELSEFLWVAAMLVYEEGRRRDRQ